MWQLREERERERAPYIGHIGLANVSLGVSYPSRHQPTQSYSQQPEQQNSLGDKFILSNDIFFAHTMFDATSPGAAATEQAFQGSLKKVGNLRGVHSWWVHILYGCTRVMLRLFSMRKWVCQGLVMSDEGFQFVRSSLRAVVVVCCDAGGSAYHPLCQRRKLQETKQGFSNKESRREKQTAQSDTTGVEQLSLFLN